MHTVKLSADWKKFALSWSKTISPSRPSKKELEFFKKTCKEILQDKPKNIIVFGATPEFRDFLSEFKNCQTYIIDINFEMVMAMTSLMKKKNNNETWIISDWLKIPLQEKYFDLAIADLTFENLPFELQDKYFKNIARLLKPGGFYLERVFLYQPKSASITIKNFINLFKNKKINKKNISLFWETGVFFLFENLKSKETRVDEFFTKISNYLKEYNSKENININKFIKNTQNIVPGSKTWFCLDKNNYEKMVKNKFNIIKLFYGSDINMISKYKDTFPIYLLKNK